MERGLTVQQLDSWHCEKQWWWIRAAWHGLKGPQTPPLVLRSQSSRRASSTLAHPWCMCLLEMLLRQMLMVSDQAHLKSYLML
jgi:hypothetical protein